jgi:hypothetical protein
MVGSKRFAVNRCQCVGIIGKGLFEAFLWLPKESCGARVGQLFEHLPCVTVGPGRAAISCASPRLPARLIRFAAKYPQAPADDGADQPHEQRAEKV